MCAAAAAVSRPEDAIAAPEPSSRDAQELYGHGDEELSGHRDVPVYGHGDSVTGTETL